MIFFQNIALSTTVRVTANQEYFKEIVSMVTFSVMETVLCSANLQFCTNRFLSVSLSVPSSVDTPLQQSHKLILIAAQTESLFVNYSLRGMW